MSNLATITNNILADSGIDDINVIVSTGSYANPAWITSLAWTKITGAPSNIVTGTGTTNVVPKFTGTSTIGDSAISDTTTEVNITKRVFITSGVNQFVFTPNLGSTSNRIETLGGLSLEITTSGSSIGMNVGGGSSQFSMTNTGASFFIPVTSNGQAATSPAFIANNSTGTSGTAQHYINFTAGTTTIARMLRGNGAAGLVANGLNIDNFDGFQVRLNQLGGSGGSFNITGGNVGIGTTSPTFRLDVQNNTQAVARVLDTSTNASLILQAGSGSAMKVTAYNYASSTALPLYIQVDGANTIMQSGGGNLLVGTTTDNGARLQVSGSGNFTGTLTSTELTLNKGASDTIGAGSYVYYSNVGGTRGAVHQLNAAFGLDTFTFDGSTWSRRITVTNGGNVGIGTASPTQRLHVIGNALFNNSSFGTASIRLLGVGSSTGLDILADSNDGYFWNRDTGNIYFATSNTERMRITSSGNVGIGTTNATGQSSDNRVIQIYGAGVANRAQIHFVNVNTGETATDGSFIGIDSNSELFIINRENAATVFENNGGESMRITAGRNVLIGTTTDNGARLQVSGGAVSFNNGSAQSSIIGTTFTGFEYTRGSTIFGFIGTENSASGGMRYNSVAGNFEHKFYNNSNLALTLSSIGAATFSSSAFNVATFNSTFGQMAISFANNGTTFSQIGSGVSVCSTAAADDLGFGTAGLNKNIVFATGTGFTERMRITSSGNVGIGTTSPTPHNGTNALVVQGGSGSRGIMEIWDNSGAGGKAVFQQVGGDTYLGSLAKGSGSGDLFLLVNGTGTSATVSTIFKASGNVLIGTTTDAGYRLNVSGISSSTTGFLLSSGQYTSISGVPYIGMFATEAASSDGFGALLISSRTDVARPIIFGTSNGSVSTERMRITSGGNVGIGTTSPAEKLDVIGGGLAAGNGTIRTGITYSSLGLIGTFTNHDLGILTNGSIKATITSGGNVLIGTTSDNGNRLRVNGNSDFVGTMFVNTPSSGAGVTFRTTGNTNNPGIFFITDESTSKGTILVSGSTGALDMALGAGGTERVFIKGNSGNVLIGTTTDVGARLYVDGAFRTGTLTAGTQTAAVDWRLGNARGGTATANALIRVQINGVLVDLIGNYV